MLLLFWSKGKGGSFVLFTSLWSAQKHTMSDSEDSDFSDNQSERSSDGEAEEVEENEVC